MQIALTTATKAKGFVSFEAEQVLGRMIESIPPSRCIAVLLSCAERQGQLPQYQALVANYLALSMVRNSKSLNMSECGKQLMRIGTRSIGAASGAVREGGKRILWALSDAGYARVGSPSFRRLNEADRSKVEKVLRAVRPVTFKARQRPVQSQHSSRGVMSTPVRDSSSTSSIAHAAAARDAPRSARASGAYGAGVGADGGAFGAAVDDPFAPSPFGRGAARSGNNARGEGAFGQSAVSTDFMPGKRLARTPPKGSARGSPLPMRDDGSAARGASPAPGYAESGGGAEAKPTSVRGAVAYREAMEEKEPGLKDETESVASAAEGGSAGGGSSGRGRARRGAGRTRRGRGGSKTLSSPSISVRRAALSTRCSASRFVSSVCFVFAFCLERSPRPLCSPVAHVAFSSRVCSHARAFSCSLSVVCCLFCLLSSVFFLFIPRRSSKSRSPLICATRNATIGRNGAMQLKASRRWSPTNRPSWGARGSSTSSIA